MSQGGQCHGGPRSCFCLVPCVHGLGCKVPFYSGIGASQLVGDSQGTGSTPFAINRAEVIPNASANGYTPVPQGVYPKSIPETGLHPAADSGPPNSNLFMRENEYLIMPLDNLLVNKLWFEHRHRLTGHRRHRRFVFTGAKSPSIQAPPPLGR